MSKIVVIVGGVAGGANVAAQLRRDDQESEIILFDKGEHIAFSTCGMPYYIGGVVDKREHLLVNADQFAEKYNVNVQTNTEVTFIDRGNKQITYRNKTGKQRKSYDKLVLSPGASAIKPDLKGTDDERVFTLHSIPDMDAIHNFIQTKKPRTCAIIGAGFVGLEMVENLKALGIDCTVVDRSEQVMKLVDQDMASIIEDHLKAKDVQLILNDQLDSFSNNSKTLHLNSGKILQADMTILAAGIRPNTKLARDSELEIGSTGAIKVNEYMQSSDPDIYALGDAVQTNNPLTGSPRHVALAGPAHRQAFVVAAHLNSDEIEYAGTLGSAIFKVFDMTVGSTGLNKAVLDHLKIGYIEITHETLSHAGYYPGAENICIKILFDEKTGRLYGAQVIGEEGVDKRLAVLATAMKAGLTVRGLPELELGYAPPYSSPKDPVNVIGYKAEKALE
ncbi:NADPH-dependent 2,4-dienoyl-CoA reductase, sulfur reductase [Lentibacillus halodurans]|uniref:NADPH-dependent 2,4-dienoyl-CoA reductase, sulfur reductase n=1 Tax=Lentibacillus halodurans TaxID=237679 RepID=A0A1I0YUB9_9BACI|nr:CoA-disulfide reductase [Lentibacillus halodurans]SFB16030.1 NADPH-dependent 2,4-dienoyl-CoA reductase, sulfur reductase [Lentibacillus halodurans]